MTEHQPIWSVAYYQVAIQACLKESKASTLSAIFGPTLSNTHKMTPSALMRAVPCLKRLAARLPDLKLNALKLEHALLAIIKEDLRLLEAD